MQTDLQKIVSISGRPGLYKYLSQARHGIIVESINDGKRTCISSSVKISSLAEITVYSSNGDDLLLKEIFLKIKEKTNGEKALSHKSPQEELMAYFEEIVPECDKEKVYPHHVRKMIEWYNILQENYLLDFEEDEDEEDKEEQANKEDEQEENKEINEPENSSSSN
jgi:cobalamin biosynthesis protein CobT